MRRKVCAGVPAYLFSTILDKIIRCLHFMENFRSHGFDEVLLYVCHTACVSINHTLNVAQRPTGASSLGTR